MINFNDDNGKPVQVSPYVRKKGGIKNAPFVSLSKSGFNFSAGFCDKHQITGEQYIAFACAGDNFLLGISHDSSVLEEQFGSAPLKLVGNNLNIGARKGYTTGAKEFVKTQMSAVMEKIKEDGRPVHFYPKSKVCTLNNGSRLSSSIKTFSFKAENKFDKSISFEALYDDTSRNGVFCVYRYINDQGEVIYIGRGDLRGRFLDAINSRGYEGITSIEYNLTNDLSTAKSLEASEIEEYENKHGKLPLYNKQRGG